MALTNIEYGSLASSQVMNNNFEYLDNRITTLASNVTTGNASIYSSIASINNQITEVLNLLRPIGQPIIRLDNTLNPDEIRLEGAEVSRTTYAALFAIYGVTYGAGDGVTTFKLPDFRNKVMWGSDQFGLLEATLPNITGQFYAEDQSNGGGCSGALTGSLIKRGVHSGEGGAYRNLYSFSAANSSSVYQEGASVRPASVQIRVVTRFQ